MNLFPAQLREQLVSLWKLASDNEKDYFVDQIALTLTFLGDEGKEVVRRALTHLVEDNCKNVADVGLYIMKEVDNPALNNALWRYRFRKGLPGEPRKVIA
jgi:hypothetical protein